MKSSATCQSQFKSPSCSSNAAPLATPSRRNHGEVSTCSSSPLDCTPQAHSVSQMATAPRSSSPGVQRPLKRRLLMAFDNSTTPEPAGISKRRRSTGHSTSSIRSASKSPLPSPAPSTHSNQSESDSVHTSDLERQNSNRISNSECIVDGRKLTERQQLAMVLQMTANDSNSKTEDEEHHATARSSVSSSRQHRPVDESVARRIPARLNKRNERGETPLHVASIRGDAPLVAALISRGADVVSKDYAGWTPLHEACSHGHVDVVVELLEGGAPINAPGFDKERPLHDAVSNNHASTVEVLLRYGADPDLRNAKGQTALDYARFLGHNHILKLLGSEDLPAQEIPSSRAGAHAPPSSGNVESASLDSFPAADNHSSEGGLSCHSASPSGPAEKSPDSELSHKNMEPDCSPSPLLSSFNNCPQSSEVGPLHAGLGLPHSPVSSSASSTNNSSLSSSPSKCALQGTFTACSAPILESPAPHSTPKSCSPLSRFRTPCSSITSRDSGICINSSSSCFSPTTHDSSILSESVCTTPRIQVSATPPTPPSLSPIEKEKRRPFKAQKYSRARFDMLSLNDKYRDRPKVGSKHEDLPCTHTSQLVPSSPAELNDYLQKREQEAEKKAFASVPNMPAGIPKEFSSLWQEIHSERHSLRQRFELQRERLVSTYQRNGERIESRSKSLTRGLSFCQIEMACQTNGKVLDGGNLSQIGAECPESVSGVEGLHAANDAKEAGALGELQVTQNFEWEGLLGLQCMKWNSLCTKLAVCVSLPE